MYAEARAAREAAANPSEHLINDTQIKGPNPVCIGKVDDRWWITQIEKAGERFRQAPHPRGKSTTR